MTMFVKWFPGLPQWLGRRGIQAVLDDHLLDALGYPRPPRALRATAYASLKARGRASRLLGERRRPRIRTTMRHRSYRDGYAIEELGPEPASSIRRAP
jgi:hypothetical protein